MLFASGTPESRLLLAPKGRTKTSTEFGGAARVRQEEVPKEYEKRAKKLDTELHPDTPPPGPFECILQQFGTVKGLVVCFSGEASPDVHELADFVALQLASKHFTGQQ